MKCPACGKPVPTPGGYFRTHGAKGRLCPMSAEPTPARLEVLGRHDDERVRRRRPVKQEAFKGRVLPPRTVQGRRWM